MQAVLLQYDFIAVLNSTLASDPVAAQREALAWMAALGWSHTVYSRHDLDSSRVDPDVKAKVDAWMPKVGGTVGAVCRAGARPGTAGRADVMTLTTLAVPWWTLVSWPRTMHGCQGWGD